MAKFPTYAIELGSAELALFEQLLQDEISTNVPLGSEESPGQHERTHALTVLCTKVQEILVRANSEEEHYFHDGVPQGCVRPPAARPSCAAAPALRPDHPA